MKQLEVPTAEEYLVSKGMTGTAPYGLLITNPSSTKLHEIMEDFANIKARFHVQQALEAAAEKAETKISAYHQDEDMKPIYRTDKNTILNAYPLTNIK